MTLAALIEFFTSLTSRRFPVSSSPRISWRTCINMQLSILVLHRWTPLSTLKGQPLVNPTCPLSQPDPSHHTWSTSGSHLCRAEHKPSFFPLSQLQLSLCQTWFSPGQDGFHQVRMVLTPHVQGFAGFWWEKRKQTHCKMGDPSRCRFYHHSCGSGGSVNAPWHQGTQKLWDCPPRLVMVTGSSQFSGTGSGFQCFRSATRQV